MKNKAYTISLSERALHRCLVACLLILATCLTSELPPTVADAAPTKARVAQAPAHRQRTSARSAMPASRAAQDQRTELAVVEPVAVPPEPISSPSVAPVVLPQQPRIVTGKAPSKTIAKPRPRTRTVYMEVTAYCPCKKCCGRHARGITASGKNVRYNRGRFVAADRMLPFGTRLSIPGYHGGRPVEVVDRGGAIKGYRLDVFFPTHAQAKKWGRQILPVKVHE